MRIRDLFGTVVLALTLTATSARGQSLDGAWQVGLHLGEFPFRGSFKLGVQVGYQFNQQAYVGFVYQIRDRVRRDGSSFNAKATGLDGLVRSSEEVGPRMYLQARLRPTRRSPYLSLGLVLNGTDTETMRFEPSSSLTDDGAITIVQTRRSGLRPAIGLGYEHALDSGLSLHAEWAGWWLRGSPAPDVSIHGEGLSEVDRQALAHRLVKAFQSSPFNTYHVFQVGLGYTWSRSGR